jgi:hypothetical protein
MYEFILIWFMLIALSEWRTKWSGKAVAPPQAVNVGVSWILAVIFYAVTKITLHIVNLGMPQ